MGAEPVAIPVRPGLDSESRDQRTREVCEGGGSVEEKEMAGREWSRVPAAHVEAGGERFSGGGSLLRAPQGPRGTLSARALSRWFPR
jgi:hypothetical protein